MKTKIVNGDEAPASGTKWPKLFRTEAGSIWLASRWDYGVMLHSALTGEPSFAADKGMVDFRSDLVTEVKEPVTITFTP